MINLSLQYAHQDGTAEERGTASLQQALDAFRAFPWDEQLHQANELQICAPTLFLKKSDGASVFFVSIMEGEKLDFMLYLETTEEVERWGLFGKRKRKKAVIYDSIGHARQGVEEAIRAYYADDKKRLREIIQARNCA
jgi:hypothetical protein